MGRIFEIEVKTSERVDLVDITELIRSKIKESQVRSGVAYVFVPHTTAALIINENERGLLQDIKKKMIFLFPINEKYMHNLIDNNAHAHLISSFLGNSLSLIINEGDLVLGTWQSIFLVEGDGPRNRKVIVKVIADVEEHK
jgi:secondary thiamine-phosphate synthase enzyme